MDTPRLLLPVALFDKYLDALYPLWFPLRHKELFNAAAAVAAEIRADLETRLRHAIDAGHTIPLPEPYHQTITPNDNEYGDFRVHSGPWVRCTNKLKLYNYVLFEAQFIWEMVGWFHPDHDPYHDSWPRLGLGGVFEAMDPDRPLRKSLSRCGDGVSVAAAVYGRRRTPDETQALYKMFGVEPAALPVYIDAAGVPCYDMMPALDDLFEVKKPYGDFGICHSHDAPFLDLDA